MSSSSRPPASKDGRAGTSVMVAGAAISAVGAYLFQVIGARYLGAEAFAPVSVIWTVLFLGFTVFLLPVEQLVIRRVTLAGGRPRAVIDSWPAIAVVIGSASLIAVGFAAAVRGPLLAGDGAYLVVSGAMFPAYGLYAVGRGALAGSARFSSYGRLVVADTLVKVGGAVAVAVLGLGGVALSWVLVASPVVVLAFRPFGRDGRGVEESIPGAGSDRRFLGGYLVATAASQTILASGPLVVGALGASAASVSVFFVTTTLFRGPVSASYNLLARVLPSVTRRAVGGESGGDAALDRIVRIVAAVGLAAAMVGGAAAAAVGPAVVEFLYGGDFRPGSPLAGLTAAAVIAALAGLIVTQILVGRGHTGRLAVAWVAALGAAVIVIALAPFEDTIRVATGFVAGESVALVALSAAALARRGRKTVGGDGSDE